MTSLIALSLDLELFVAVDNNIEIFADGLRLGEHHGWSTATFSLPGNTSVLAFNARNSGGPGAVLASLSNGIVTDDTWLCSVGDPPDDGKMMLMNHSLLVESVLIIMHRYSAQESVGLNPDSR